MAYSCRKCIGRMIWPWYLIQIKNNLDHLLNLSFLSPSLAYNSPLDDYRGILPQRNTVLGKNQMDNTFGMSHRKCTGYVLGKEKGLYAALFRLVHINDLVKILINVKKPLSKRLFRRGLDDPMCNIFYFITHSLYDAKACRCKSRIDSDNSHEVQSSSSKSSGTSRSCETS